MHLGFANTHFEQMTEPYEHAQDNAMIKVAFFGHDAGDAAVRRRVRAMQDGGVSVIGFMMRRQDNVAPEWTNVDLGQTRDSAFLQRIMRVFSGARIAADRSDALSDVDVIYARNLDMLACAFLAKRYAKLDTPVIYESLDVHRLLTRADWIGVVFRGIERRLLRRTIGLVVSSPGFLRNHFEKHYSGSYTPFLVENRLAAASEFGPRPEPADTRQQVSRPDARLRVGWVGNLRCQRSFDLLCELADRYRDRIDIKLHGQPARTEIPVFEPEIDARANVSFAGRYRSPEDLAAIYDGLDVVWAGDFMEAGFNSSWLLPNRIYEGGYYATPAIAPAGTQTAAWIKQNDCGFSLEEPLEETLPELFQNMIDDRGRLAACRSRLLEMPNEVFIEPNGFFAEVLEQALTRARSK